MALIWEGDIAVETSGDAGFVLRTLQFFTHAGTASSPVISSTTQLRYGALIATAQTPLHLIDGPSMVVYSSDAPTEKHLWDMLVADQLSEEILPTIVSPLFESERALLLHIEDDGCTASDLLIYAAACPPYPSRYRHGLITPPGSSSPRPLIDEMADEIEEESTPICVYAQPLRSLSSFSTLFTTTPFPASEQPLNHGIAIALPSPAVEPPAPKRPCLDGVFSAASSATRRASRAGGKTVTKLMAPRSANGTGLVRAHTLGNLNEIRTRPSTSGSGSGGVTGSAAPIVRQPSRASLHRVATMPARTGDDTTMPPLSVPLPDLLAETPELDADAASQSKAALSRVVLAALRMWGHAPPGSISGRRKRSASRVNVEGTVDTEAVPALDSLFEGAEDPESSEVFKALYHATYSAAKFALRRTWGTGVLKQESMRGAVERVLEVFLGNTGVG